MPKRKKLPKLPDYEGIGNSPNNSCVEKSRPLQSLSQTNLTLPELKILDAYLARIDSHNPNKRTVKLEKGELERYLGVSRILREDLNKRLRNLFQIIEVRDDNKRKGFKLINLFEEAEAEQDENGLWQVILTCTQSAREYVFNIDNIGYLKYRLKNIINLTSRYSYILFLYLLDNNFRKKWTISLDELKFKLNCTADTYNQFYRFNDLILKKCQKEINEKTDLFFTYTPVKKGRKVTEIEFVLKTVAEKISENLDDLDGQLTFDETEPHDTDYGGELANLLGDAALDNEFTPEQVRIIQDLVLQAVPSNDNMKMCDYLVQQVHRMNYYAQQDPIKDRFAYLQKMIKSDIKSENN